MLKMDHINWTVTVSRRLLLYIFKGQFIYILNNPWMGLNCTVQ